MLGKLVLLFPPSTPTASKKQQHQQDKPSLQIHTTKCYMGKFYETYLFFFNWEQGTKGHHWCHKVKTIQFKYILWSIVLHLSSMVCVHNLFIPVLNTFFHFNLTVNVSLSIQYISFTFPNHWSFETIYMLWLSDCLLKVFLISICHRIFP